MRFALDLKRNFIFFGMLDANGCVVQIDNVAIKVIKGVMTIIKGTMKNGLYVLDGETIIVHVSLKNDTTEL